ncbi:hypothetical protein E9840_04720 [Tissierella creatinini]|nr:hypothetical protein E9840_04720 [Tissierella creatinini]TJX67146.1 hypothetical protein E8P77_05950 [Soehngenia saccharolytica]
MKYLILISSSFGGGVLVGGAYAAFITLIKVFPRFIQLTETKGYLKLYETIYGISTLIFTIIYFSGYNVELGKGFTLFAGLFSGIFLGMFASALAETLNVIPVISKKFKIKKRIKLVLVAILIGKVCGALYYFIILGGSNG